MTQLSLAQAQQALEHAPIATLFLDAHQSIVWVNAITKKFFGETGRDLINRSFSDVVSQTLQSVSAHEGVYYIPPAEHRPERWVECSGQRLEPGEIKYFVDVTQARQVKLQHERIMQQMMELAPMDPSTGLLTTRALMQNLEPLVSRSRRYHNPLSVVVMNVAGLADYQRNTQQVLLAVGHLLKDQMRWADLISRSPTDEFVMVLPETSRDSAIKLVDKIKTHLGGLEVPNAHGQMVKVDAHFGVAGWQKEDDAQQLLKRAHEAVVQMRRGVVLSS